MSKKMDKPDMLDALWHREQVALKRVEHDEIEAAAAKAEAASVRAAYRRALARADAKKSTASVRYRDAALALSAAEAAFKKARIESARANAAFNRSAHGMTAKLPPPTPPQNKPSPIGKRPAMTSPMHSTKQTTLPPRCLPPNPKKTPAQSHPPNHNADAQRHPRPSSRSEIPSRRRRGRGNRMDRRARLPSGKTVAPRLARCR
jgi:hypothetical protein